VENETVTQHFFESQNKRRLGDTGQDIIVYGDKLYIAMFGESTIEVTDLEAKEIKQIKTEGQPRNFEAYGGKIYVTYFNGYVARIDTSSLVVEATVKVGRNPEQLAVSNGKLFVANSGGLDFNTETGYDKTVSVIDIATFTEERKIEVGINPCDVVADNSGNVYVVSMGNYMDIPTVIQKINATTGAVTVMTDFNGSYLTATGNTLYTIHLEYDAFWNQTVTYYAYDMANNLVLSNHFIGDTTIDNPFKVCSDVASGDVFITSSDYISDGDVYVFDKTGQFMRKFEAGLNPIKAVKIKR
jgi:YVTN family beta-propeller protein